MLRRILGLVAGIIVAGLTVGVIESIGHLIWPPPPGTDISKPDQLKAIIETIPLPAKISVMVAWFLGTLAGAFTALKITRWPVAPWGVAGFVIAAGGWTMMQIPHPVWMVVGAVALPLAAAWIAGKLAPAA